MQARRVTAPLPKLSLTYFFFVLSQGHKNTNQKIMEKGLFGQILGMLALLLNAFHSIQLCLFLRVYAVIWFGLVVVSLMFVYRKIVRK